MIIEGNCNISDLVIHQLRSYWTEVDESVIRDHVPEALRAMEINFEAYGDHRYISDGQFVFSPYISTQWVIFLYRLSRLLEQAGSRIMADQVYYLNKILHSVDWLYAIDLPTHFYCEHPLGSVLGRAKYGDYLVVYQGVTVGGNRTQDGLHYPTIGENVTLYANTTVLGDTTIGNNVVISADTFLINERVPDNCIVFGRSPSIVIKEKPIDEMIPYINMLRGWM